MPCLGAEWAPARCFWLLRRLSGEAYFSGLHRHRYGGPLRSGYMRDVSISLGQYQTPAGTYYKELVELYRATRRSSV